jgi:hypothetical protein
MQLIFPLPGVLMQPRNNVLWFGFLEAGKASSPVVRDDSLDTGNPANLYLYNHARGAILEYRKDIVERKLRDLRQDEAAALDSLKSAFVEVRDRFTPRCSGRPRAGPRPQPRRQAFEEPTDGGDDDSEIPDLSELDGEWQGPADDGDDDDS